VAGQVGWLDQGRTELSEATDWLDQVNSGDARWDGSPDWHLPNGFASWRNATHAFAFGGQQSGMALDNHLSKQDHIKCNDAEGVL
jgi:hypothetical protein